jgi:hypothetical protein
MKLLRPRSAQTGGFASKHLCMQPMSDQEKLINSEYRRILVRHWKQAMATPPENNPFKLADLEKVKLFAANA